MEREIRRRFSQPRQVTPAADTNHQNVMQLLMQILGNITEVSQAVARVEDQMLQVGAASPSIGLDSEPVDRAERRRSRRTSEARVSIWSDGGQRGLIPMAPAPEKMIREESKPLSSVALQRMNGAHGSHNGNKGEPNPTASVSQPGSQVLGSRSPEEAMEHDRLSRGSSFLSFGSGTDVSETLQVAWEEKLGRGWPATIPLRVGLEGTTKVDGERIIQAISQGGNLLIAEPSFAHIQTPRLPLDPNSRFVTRMDMIKLVVLLYDVLMAPYLACWDVRVSGNLMITAMIAASFWLFDCMLHFVTGFYVKGDLIMDLGRVVRTYLRRPFWKDFGLIFCDWTVIFCDAFLPESVQSVELDILVSVVRTCRLLKLLRVLRLIKLLDKISKASLLASTLIVAQMIRIPMGLIVYNHIVSCVWGFIGRRAPTNTGHRWLDGTIHLPAGVDTYGEDPPTYSDLESHEQYLVAFHWTLAQMTPGPTNIHAGSSFERAFNVLVLVCGMLFGSMIVSQFSSIIMQMTLLQREQIQKLDKVRRFLMQRKIGASLALRVQKQVTQRLSEEVPLQVHDVPAFELLANALRDELLREVRMPHLLSHAVFSLWQRMDKKGLYSFVAQGVQFFFLPPPEVLFEPLHEGNEAYLIVSGRLLYTQAPPTSWEFVREELKNGTWLCEAALWSDWVHVGKVEAEVATELLVVSSEALMAEFNRDHPACHLLKHYGRSYHQRILSAVPPYARWPTDLRVPFTEVSDLLGPHVGIGMLQSAIGNGHLHITKEAEQELMHELLEEKCALITNKDGHLERVVSVVALKVRDQAGNIFVELGTCDATGKRKARCTLPGGKRAMNEVPQKAMRRVLEKRMPGLIDVLELDGTQQSQERKESPNFNMTSTYTKTLHTGIIARPLNLVGYSTKQLDDEKPADLPIIMEEVTFVMDGKGGWLLYGFVPQAHYDILSSEDSQKALQKWLKNLTCDCALQMDL
mmetsp:Transcript_38841/g.91404  ORF Transcript_38841/g.91404 Transcript_38841/m.91404 type:complete len:972 (+) Transcript_38841:112-3027(+)